MNGNKVSVTMSIAALIAIMGLAYKGGSEVTAVQSDIKALMEFRDDSRKTHRSTRRNTNRLERKISRVEVMLEMGLRARGMTPPAPVRDYGEDVSD